MPILHTQLRAQGKNPDGSLVEINPADVMVGKGPIVQVTVHVAQPIAAQLTTDGKQLPNTVSGHGLIDTGASTTCIDDQIARNLGLPIVDVVQMSSASHSSSDANIYPIAVEIEGLPIRINVPRSMGAALSAQGLLLLIGRDVLHHCTLFYNGITGEFTISI